MTPRAIFSSALSVFSLLVFYSVALAEPAASAAAAAADDALSGNKLLGAAGIIIALTYMFERVLPFVGGASKQGSSSTTTTTTTPPFPGCITAAEFSNQITRLSNGHREELAQLNQNGRLLAQILADLRSDTHSMHKDLMRVIAEVEAGK